MLSRLLLCAATAGLMAATPLPHSLAESDILAGLPPVQDSDFYQDARFPESQVQLGRLLFFDKILSGNRNISCASCHHPALGTSDNLPLPLGEGAAGLGRDRRVRPETPVLGRVPRNSQSLFFLGAREYVSLFHDGRVEADPLQTWESGFWSPAREQLPGGLDNVLAAQAMFPVLSEIEMAGHKGENPVATAAANDRLGGPGGAWDLLVGRLRAIPAYVELFKAAYAEVQTADDITFVHAANAIAAFETTAFRPDDSPFDRFLRSRDPEVLAPAARRGMRLFYGEAGCARCHSGKLQTDHKFHAIAMPQIGPGKRDGWDQSYWEATGFPARLQDFGRYRVTRDPRDRYRFRTPSLRNVELTGPWGHDGAYASLEAVVRHHLDPVAALEGYDTAASALPPVDAVIQQSAVGSQLIHRPVNPARLDDFRQRDLWVQRTPHLRRDIAAANELPAVELSDAAVADLLSFLKALTDPRSRNPAGLVPESVPSGLPVED